MKAGPVMHPAAWKLFQTAAERLMELRGQHRQSADMMWAGMVSSFFTPNEIALLDKHGYLSAHDKQLLRATRKAAQIDALKER